MKLLLLLQPKLSQCSQSFPNCSLTSDCASIEYSRDPRLLASILYPSFLYLSVTAFHFSLIKLPATSSLTTASREHTCLSQSHIYLLKSTEVQLIYNVLISAVQSDFSYTSFSYFHYGLWQDIEQTPVLYSRTLFIDSIYNSLCFPGGSGLYQTL